MNKVIVYEQDDGAVAVVYPTEEALEFDGIDSIADKVVPEGKAYTTIDRSTIPSDRVFRNAWKLNGEKISEDWAKSVEITKERLRAERAPLLEAADVQALRDIETTGAVRPATATVKQALRDVTALADSAKSRDELLALKAAAVVKA